MSYFPEPHTRSKNEIKDELKLSNNATKSDLKNASGLDTPTFAKKTDLASLKSDIYKLYIVKLESTSADLIKLSNVVENDVVKKIIYD